MSIELVTAVGVVIGFLYLLVVMQIFVARLRNRLLKNRQNRIERVWLPILVADTEVPRTLPPLGSRDVIPFLTLWNQLQESFTGDITQRLTEAFA